MKLEKTFHDEIQQFLKLGWDIKVIPWTAGESSRSKIFGKNPGYDLGFTSDLHINRHELIRSCN